MALILAKIIHFIYVTPENITRSLLANHSVEVFIYYYKY